MMTKLKFIEDNKLLFLFITRHQNIIPFKKYVKLISIKNKEIENEPIVRFLPNDIIKDKWRLL